MLSTLIVMNLAATVLAAPADSRPAGPADLRVMSFNIRYGTANDGKNHWNERKELVFDVLREHRPDVVGLQEALRFQLDEIRAAVPGYDEVGHGRDDGKQAGEYSAILYRADRLRPVESGTFWLSDTPEKPGSKTWGNTIPRICSWARFEDRQGGAFYIYNTHFDHISQPSRERSAELLVRRIADRKAPDVPVIATGDFNAGERNPAIRYLLGKPQHEEGTPVGLNLRDSFRVMHPEAKPVGTFHGFTGKKDGDKIDYIFVTPGLEVLEAAILRDNRDGRYPSDHYPVTTRLRLTRSP